MTNIICLNLVGLRRISYFANPSFWVCEDNVENRKILNENKISFNINSFYSAAGTRCSRIEIL